LPAKPVAFFMKTGASTFLASGEQVSVGNSGLGHAHEGTLITARTTARREAGSMGVFEV
jgi:hypothetical protein